jgi:hypothetical protein
MKPHTETEGYHRKELEVRSEMESDLGPSPAIDSTAAAACGELWCAPVCGIGAREV